MRSRRVLARSARPLVWLAVALVGLPMARAAHGVPACSDDVVAAIEALCPSPDSRLGLATQSSGAEALLCMPAPAAWNGDLILFARGNTLFAGDDCKLASVVPQLDLAGTGLPQLANQLGFGFATTSCSSDVIALEECKADVVDLAADFQTFLDALEAQHDGAVDYGAFDGRTYLTGASLGGLVTTQLIEEAGPAAAAAAGSDLFVGGLAACGPIGSAAALVRYQGDALMLTDCLYRDAWAALGLPDGLVFPDDQRRPVLAPEISLDDLAAFADFCGDIAAVIDADPERAAQLLRIMAATGQRLAIDPSGAITVGETIADLLCGDALPAVLYFAERFGGNPYDNLRRRYLDPQAGAAANLALNRCVDRFAAEVEPAAFETSGAPARPLVGLHTVDDPRVPFSQLLRYQVKVLQQGSRANLTPIPDPSFGHCAFDRETILLALAVLFFRVEGFDLPGVAAVLEDADALVRFDERLARLR